MPLVLTPGQRHEATAFERLLEQGAVRRPGRGRPRSRPARVAGGKGDTGRVRRAACRGRGIRSTIPRRRDEHRSGPFDRAVYRRRHRVDNLIARCKQYRSLATRYDKRAASYQARWTIAMTILWLHDYPLFAK
jgi:transposase